MLLHALRQAEPADRQRALQILAQRRPSRRRASCGSARCWTSWSHATSSSPAGRAEILAQLRAPTRTGQDPRRRPLALPRCCGGPARWTTPERWPAGRPTRRRPCWPHWTGCRPAGTATYSTGSSTTCTSAPDERPERRDAARPAGRAGPDPCPRRRARWSAAPRSCCPSRGDRGRTAHGRAYELLAGARRAVIGNPAAAREPARPAGRARAAATPRPRRARSCATRWSDPRRSTTCAASGRR